MKPCCGDSPLGDTVVPLLDRLAGHGYRLFMNYYNSVGLSERLLDLNTLFCGTLRNNGGEPSVIHDVGNANLSREGAPVVRHKKGNCLSLARQTNSENGDNIPSEQHGKHPGMAKVPKPKPACIVE